MNTAQQLRQAARCLAVVQHYHDSERTATRREAMGLEVGLIATWLLGLGLPAGTAEVGVLAPVEAELLARYGPEAGRRLNGEFVEAFERWGMDLLSRSRGDASGAPGRAGGARGG